jgi:hypothetical protein
MKLIIHRTRVERKVKVPGIAGCRLRVAGQDRQSAIPDQSVTKCGGKVRPSACSIPATCWSKWTWTSRLACGEPRRASPDSLAPVSSTPLSDEEVQHIVYKVADSREKPKLVKFEKNESVRIEGPFASFAALSTSERRPQTKSWSIWRSPQLSRVQPGGKIPCGELHRSFDDEECRLR